jgi:hypothetical protein
MITNITINDFHTDSIYNTHSNVVSTELDLSGDTTAKDNDGNVVVLDEALISAEVTRLQAEFDSQQYARDRAEAYPSLTDQLDALFHAGVFPAEMAATLQAVKDAHPKP